MAQVCPRALLTPSLLGTPQRYGLLTGRRTTKLGPQGRAAMPESRVPSAWSQEGVHLCLQGVPFFGGRGAVEADDMVPR